MKKDGRSDGCRHDTIGLSACLSGRLTQIGSHYERTKHHAVISCNHCASVFCTSANLYMMENRHNS